MEITSFVMASLISSSSPSLLLTCVLRIKPVVVDSKSLFPVFSVLCFAFSRVFAFRRDFGGDFRGDFLGDMDLRALLELLLELTLGRVFAPTDLICPKFVARTLLALDSPFRRPLPE